MQAEARSTEEVLARFRSLRSRAQDKVASKEEERARQAYLEAAAVLHVFSLSALEPVGKNVPGGAAVHLLREASVPAIGWAAENLRTLRLDVRREVLSRMRTRQALKDALAANPKRRMTDVQTMLERWLDGARLRPREMPSGDIQALRLLAEWGLDHFEGFPSRASLEGAWRRRSVVAPFEKLGGKFVGRDRELDELRELVGLSPAPLGSMLRRFLHWQNPFQTGVGSRPIYVHGPGGVGKTALIARFLLDYFDTPKAAKFPFIYLPFDDIALDPVEPVTLIASSLRQLEAQSFTRNNLASDGIKRELQVSDELLRRYLSRRDYLGRRASNVSSRSDRLGMINDDERELLKQFTIVLKLVSRICGDEAKSKTEAPVVMILDTFEEVDYRPHNDLRRLEEFLKTLIGEVPQLRLVIAGRSPPEKVWQGRLPLHPLPVSDMERKDAILMLQRLGVSDRRLAESAVGQLGSNPLTLRLAARVLTDQDAGARDIKSVRTRNYGLFRVSEEVIRGQLYHRILAHIHDPDVRMLAHPGMVLRRVTPDLIREVLAPVCGLTKLGNGRVDELFHELAREHSLVRFDPSGALTYREEIRRPMLALLAADKPAQSEQLHRRAFDYYRAHTDLVSRAEAIYHGLMLGDVDRHFIERLWDPELARYLTSAIDELSPSSKITLASVMSLRLSPEDREQGESAERERIVGRETLRLLLYEDFAAALQAIESLGRLQPDSPLHAVRGRVLLAMGRPAEAYMDLKEAIERFPLFQKPGRLAELYWLAAQAARANKRADLAAEWLEQLIPVARRLSPRAEIQALTELVDVVNDDRIQSARAELAAALRAIDTNEVDRERALIRLALRRLGLEYGDCWRRLAPLVAYDLINVFSYQRSVDQGVMVKVGDLLARSESTVLRDLGHRLGKASSSPLLSDAISVLVKERADPLALTALRELFDAEGATLAADTLAGLEGYRERWELDSGPEALS